MGEKDGFSDFVQRVLGKTTDTVSLPVDSDSLKLSPPRTDTETIQNSKSDSNSKFEPVAHIQNSIPLAQSPVQVTSSDMLSSDQDPEQDMMNKLKKNSHEIFGKTTRCEVKSWYITSKNQIFHRNRYEIARGNYGKFSNFGSEIQI